MAKVFVRDLKPLAWNGKETGDRNVTHLQFDPLGDYCAIMRIDGSLSLWNMASLPTEIFQLPPPLPSLELSPHLLVNIAWSDNSSLIASTIQLPDEIGGGTYLTVWDLKTPFPITKPFLALRVPAEISGLIIINSSDTTSSRGTLLWSLTSQSQLFTFPIPSPLTFSSTCTSPELTIWTPEFTSSSAQSTSASLQSYSSVKHPVASSSSNSSGDSFSISPDLFHPLQALSQAIPLSLASPSALLASLYSGEEPSAHLSALLALQQASLSAPQSGLLYALTLISHSHSSPQPQSSTAATVTQGDSRDRDPQLPSFSHSYALLSFQFSSSELKILTITTLSNYPFSLSSAEHLLLSHPTLLASIHLSLSPLYSHLLISFPSLGSLHEIPSASLEIPFAYNISFSLVSFSSATAVRDLLPSLPFTTLPCPPLTSLSSTLYLSGCGFIWRFPTTEPLPPASAPFQILFSIASFVPSYTTNSLLPLGTHLLSPSAPSPPPANSDSSCNWSTEFLHLENLPFFLSSPSLFSALYVGGIPRHYRGHHTTYELVYRDMNTFVSDFPGAMYPPGFVVLNQVDTYEEQEDECDIFVPPAPASNSGAVPAGPPCSRGTSTNATTSSAMANSDSIDLWNCYSSPGNEENEEMGSSSDGSLNAVRLRRDCLHGRALEVKWFLRRSWREAGGWCDELLPLFAASLLQQQQGQQGQGVSVTTLTSSSAASKRAAAVAAVGRYGMSGIPDDVLLGEYETRAQVAMQERKNMKRVREDQEAVSAAIQRIKTDHDLKKKEAAMRREQTKKTKEAAAAAEIAAKLTAALPPLVPLSSPMPPPSRREERQRQREEYERIDRELREAQLAQEQSEEQGQEGVGGEGQEKGQLQQEEGQGEESSSKMEEERAEEPQQQEQHQEQQEGEEQVVPEESPLLNSSAPVATSPVRSPEAAPKVEAEAAVVVSEAEAAHEASSSSYPTPSLAQLPEDKSRDMESSESPTEMAQETAPHSYPREEEEKEGERDTTTEMKPEQQAEQQETVEKTVVPEAEDIQTSPAAAQPQQEEEQQEHGEREEAEEVKVGQLTVATEVELEPQSQQPQQEEPQKEKGPKERVE